MEIGKAVRKIIFRIILRIERWSPWINMHFVSCERIYRSI